MAPRSRRKAPTNNGAPTITDRDPQLLRRIYEVMVLTRAVEDRMVAMYRGGDLLGSFYSGHWHEAISVGAASTLRPDDYMAPIHRDLGAHLWRGMEPWQVMASFMGKATSPTGGRDGTLHYGRLDLNIYNLPSHIPANFPVATGMAFAAKYRDEDRVCLAFCGDGSTSRADFHEALTLASVLKLPNIFVIENNQYAYSTPLRMTSNSETLSAKAVAYGISLVCGFRGGPIFPAVFLGIGVAMLPVVWFHASPTLAVAIGAAAGTAAQTRLILASILFAALLVGSNGLETGSAAVLAAVAAWLTVTALGERGVAAEEEPAPA